MRLPLPTSFLARSVRVLALGPVSLAGLALGPVALATATPALADAVTIRVPYDDLDLTDADAVSELKSRLADAAAQACNRRSGWLETLASTSECQNELRRKGLVEIEARRAAATSELP